MSNTSTQVTSNSDADDCTISPGRNAERIRKPPRSESNTTSIGTSNVTNRRGHFLRSPLYLLFLLLRIVMIATPGQLEASEYTDGVDYLASAILPHMAKDTAIQTLPQGMVNDGKLNLTRSIAGAAFSSGIPYASVAIACKKVPTFCPSPSNMGAVTVYLPRVWMFILSLITDALLYRTFAVYESEHAVSAVVMYSSTWTTIVGATRNTNFALEALCLTAIVAGVFGWPIGTARPLFWLSGAAIAFSTFLRPITFLFILTPIIYLISLWGKHNVNVTRYVMAAMEGLGIFAILCTIFVTIDSLFYGTFKLRSRDSFIDSFDAFLDVIFSGDIGSLSYKGSLVYAPLNAAKESVTKEYFRTFANNTTPGQLLLSLPAVLGPIFILLIREFYKGIVFGVKEVMADMKSTTKKGKKKKGKKNAIAKEREEELALFLDTIQTTFLLGLLMEVLQKNNRLGVISLMSLVPSAITIMPSVIFGEKSNRRFRTFHFVFTIGMVLFFGVLNQGGMQRMVLNLGKGDVKEVPHNSHVVLFKGSIGHRAALGPNVNNVTLHDGGDTHLELMDVIRTLKRLPNYQEDRMLIAAAETADMEEYEFKKVGRVANLHVSTLNMPRNVDDVLKKSHLSLYKFIGDENESIIKDKEREKEEEEVRQEKEEL